MPVDVLIRPFTKELDFEEALAKLLPQHGWEPRIIKNPTEEILIKNWAAIIYNNNRDVNRLGDFPLTDSEMQQIITQVDALQSPYEVSKFIGGGLVKIKRDNDKDKINFGKEVYLKIFELAKSGKDLDKARELQQDACQIIYKMCSGKCNMYAMIKEILRLSGGPDIGGVRAPLLNLTEGDKAIAQECVQMIAAAKAKLA